jgi:hypothetical protein
MKENYLMINMDIYWLIIFSLKELMVVVYNPLKAML